MYNSPCQEQSNVDGLSQPDTLQTVNKNFSISTAELVLTWVQHFRTAMIALSDKREVIIGHFIIRIKNC